jgi:hypothetical protein
MDAKDCLDVLGLGARAAIQDHQDHAGTPGHQGKPPRFLARSRSSQQASVYRADAGTTAARPLQARGGSRPGRSHLGETGSAAICTDSVVVLAASAHMNSIRLKPMAER